MLRLILEMKGEMVERADPHIGLLHRGTEKLIEYKTYLQAMPYMDRLDYVSPMCMEHSFVLAVERLLRIEERDAASARAWIRTMFAELTRILNHLLNITTYALDCGAITPASGASSSASTCWSSTRRWAAATTTSTTSAPAASPRTSRRSSRSGSRAWCRQFPAFVDELEGAADGEPHLQAAHGRHRRDDAGAGDGMGLQRPVPARLRAAPGTCASRSPTRSTTELDFDIPVGRHGDCYDRYLVRMQEMRQSLRIVEQCLDAAGAGAGAASRTTRSRRRRAREMKRSMEALIHHFKLYTEGYHVPAGATYTVTEAPKGEFGVYMVADGTNRPYRCKIRAPGFAHLQAMEALSKGHMLADAVAIIGSLDIVFGEIDR